jgi:hypothetical protein
MFLPAVIATEFNSQMQKEELGMRFKVLTAVNMKITIIWNVTSCSLVKVVMLQTIVIIVIQVIYKLSYFCTFFVSVLFLSFLVFAFKLAFGMLT